MSAVTGVIDASRRRSGGGTPTVLGYNTKGASLRAMSNGAMNLSKWTLAAAGTLTELHGWFIGSSTPGTVRVVIYADSAGNPGARKAYTNSTALPSSAVDLEVIQTGFSVALTAGDYWVGWLCDSTSTANAYNDTTGGTSQAFAGVATPPPDPAPGGGAAGARRHSCWAIVLV